MVSGKNDYWEITVTPRGHEDIDITLGPTTNCAAAGAMCTQGGTALSSALTASIGGTPGMSAADATTEEAAIYTIAAMTRFRAMTRFC